MYLYSELAKWNIFQYLASGEALSYILYPNMQCDNAQLFFFI